MASVVGGSGYVLLHCPLNGSACAPTQYTNGAPYSLLHYWADVDFDTTPAKSNIMGLAAP
jgi:hypothetical protein